MDLKKILPTDGPPVEEVLKYVEKYKNEIIVIKYGGNVFIDREIFDNFMKSTGDKEMSTTMALVRMLTALLRDKNISPRLVPIIPDEARTFGMEGFFQKIGIYAHEGQTVSYTHLTLPTKRIV